jgi:hypothetical protein
LAAGSFRILPRESPHGPAAALCPPLTDTAS